MPFYKFRNIKTKIEVEVMIPISKISEGYRGENGDENPEDWERVYDGQGSAIRTETKNR